MTLLSDSKQRQEALDIHHSFLIQAPAGSGKTELLIQRYLKLLGEAVNDPEEIIAITFTRKAAAEMRQRIISALTFALTQAKPEKQHQLQTWQLATQVLKKDEQRQWQLLQNPSRLRILTIDSFSARLTKQLPILSQFGAQPEIEENIENLFEQASQTILTHLENSDPWNADLEILLNYLDNDASKVHRLFVSMLHNRDQWLPHVVQRNPREALESAFAIIIEMHLEKVRKIVAKLPQLISILNFAATNLSVHPICAYKNKNQFFPATANYLSEWQALANFLLTESGNWRSRFTKKEGFPPASDAINAEEKFRFQQYKEQLALLIADCAADDDILEIFRLLKMLPSPKYTEQQWELLNALVTLLPVLAAQLNLLFKQLGRVDYTEISLRALQALGASDNPTNLALILDYKINHFLVDEFQDTSVNQFRLLELLTAGWELNDGRTLFLVGDPMQSIYRFRKAEVGLFIKARDYGINQIKLKFLQLKVNFRSTATVVEWNNRVYQQIFPRYDDLAMSLVRFSDSETFKEVAENQPLPTEVQLHPSLSVGRDNESASMIKTIKQIYKLDPTAKIAILILARNHAVPVLQQLRTNQIPYRAIELENLYHNSVIQDLLALTKALLNISDKIAWYAILRGPWCGLSLADLLVIKENSKNTAILAALENYNSLSISDNAKLTLSRIVPILKRAWLSLPDFELSYLIESTWLAIGGPVVISDNDKLNIRRFFSCVEKFQQKYDVTDLHILAKQLQKLTAETPNPAENFVEVMTIHKSKGLEFDAVLIPSLDKLTRGDDHQLLMWQEIPLPTNQTELLLAPIKSDKKDSMYDYIRYLEKEKLNSELNRLLYVATTRAKHQLHLFFNVEINEADHTKLVEPKSGSLLAKLWPAIKSQLSIETSTEISSFSRVNQQLRMLKRISANWQLTHELNIDSTAFNNQNSLLSNQHLVNWEYEYEKNFGIAFHKVLEQVSTITFAKWQTLTAKQKYNIVAAAINQCNIADSITSSMIANILKGLEKMQQDDFAIWLFNQPSVTEFSIHHKLDDGQIKKLVVDKIIITNDIIWLIDFKTAIPVDQPLEDFLLQQKSQYKDQLNAYETALSNIFSQPIRSGLYFPRIPAWAEY